MYSHYKKKRKLLNKFFGGEKIIDFQNDSISVALLFKKDLYNSFRQRYDFEFRFGIENPKS